MLEHFRNPPTEYRLHALWVWDPKPDPSEVERQIWEMHAKGFGGFVIEKDPAYSPDSADANMLRCLERAARLASELGLRAFLHDRRQQPAARWGQDYSKFFYHFRQLGQRGRRSTLTRASLGALARFADSPWSAPLQEVKRAIDWQMALGASTVLAPRLPLRGESVSGSEVQHFYEAPQWACMGLLTDYAARLSYTMLQGKSNAQVALLEPSAAGENLARRLTRKYTDLYCFLLPQEHIGFDLLSEDALARATCVDQRLMAAGSAYEALLLPPLTRIAVAAAEKIREFVDDGGAVVGTGLLPYADSDGCPRQWIRDTFRHLFGQDPVQLESSTGEGCSSATQPISSYRQNVVLLPIADEGDFRKNLRQELEKVVRLSVSARWRSTECRDIVFAQRILPDGELFFFANTSNQPREVQLSMRCCGAPHILDPETGESFALANCAQQGGRTMLLYRFERYASALIYFGPEPALKVKRLTCGIDGCQIASSDVWERSVDNGTRRSVCRLSVQTPRLGQAESLVVRAAEASGVVAFKVNGTRAGVRAWAPYELDITRLVRPGEPSLIEIEETAPSDSTVSSGRRVAQVAVC